MNQSILNRPRQDKFTLVLDLPEALRSMVDSTMESSYKPDNIQFTVFGSPVPKIEVPSITLPFGGQSMKVSSYSRPAWPVLDLSFLVDSGYQNYWILWKWLNLFNNYDDSTSDISSFAGITPSGQITLKNKISQYITNFTLFALDEYNNKLVSFKYTDAFITTLGEIKFSHQESGMITGSASFAYNQLHVDLINNINKNNC